MTYCFKIVKLEPPLGNVEVYNVDIVAEYLIKVVSTLEMQTGMPAYSKVHLSIGCNDTRSFSK